MNGLKVEVKRDWGSSLGNMVSTMLGEHLDPQVWYIEVLEIRAGEYRIIAENITRPCEDLCFVAWDDEVMNTESSDSDCSFFQMSRHLKWRNVKFNLRKKRIYATSFERLREACAHVVFCALDPMDI